MTDYLLYASSCGIKQRDMVEAIQKNGWPQFGKAQMSFAANPDRNALQLIPQAEEALVAEFGKGPGLSISRRFRRGDHGNRKKPCRLCLRLDPALRSRVQKVYEQMAFATMQDLLEAAVAQFVDKYERAA